jgi:DNA-binding response OmpR family regulator
MRLLIVEDDVELAGVLRDAFARRQIASDHAATAGDGAIMLAAARYAAVVLDLGLPDGDGRTLLKRLRTRRDPTPVLILTGRSSVEDRIDALDAGADDYLIKPFEIDELIARVHALLRRKGSFQGNELTFGNLRFDTFSRELFVGDKPVFVSAREAELVELLLRRAGQVVTRRLAKDQLFGQSQALGFNAVEVNIHRLRRKLEAAAASARIENIRSIGYFLRADE